MKVLRFAVVRVLLILPSSFDGHFDSAGGKAVSIGIIGMNHHKVGAFN